MDRGGWAIPPGAPKRTGHGFHDQPRRTNRRWPGRGNYGPSYFAGFAYRRSSLAALVSLPIAQLENDNPGCSLRALSKSRLVSWLYQMELPYLRCCFFGIDGRPIYFGLANPIPFDNPSYLV